MAEETLGIIRANSWKWTLFVKTEGIVAAKVGSELLWLLFGWTGDFVAKRLAKRRSKELENLSTESILKANKKNYVINYAQIHRASVRRHEYFSQLSLNIETAEKQSMFTLSDKKRYKQDLKLLSLVLKDKLPQA